MTEHDTFPGGTAPLPVGSVKVHETVSTNWPAWYMLIVADVKARSSIDSVQLVLGQSGAPGMSVGGAVVVTLNGVQPFLISLAGIACDPDTVIGAGFCPGALLPP